MTGAERIEDFATWFERITALAPRRPAILCGDRTVTWAQLDESADRLAGYLDRAGVRPGQRFGLAARNSPDYVAALMAVLKLGATPINVNYRYRPAEMAHVLTGSGARGAVADPDVVPAVTEAGAGVVVTVDPAGGFGPEVAAARRLPRRQRADAEWVLYTGGTTGYPKAVLGRQSERLEAAWSGGFGTLGIDVDAIGPDAALRAALARDPFGPDGLVHLPASPLMHGTGIYSALGALCVGTPLALLPDRRTEGEDLLAALARHGVTDLTIVGDAFALRLLDALDSAAAEGRDPGIGRLRRIRSIGAVWTPPVKRRLLAHADVTLMDTIAASEGGVYAHARVTRETPDDEVGTFTLAPGARLLDPAGRDVPPGSDEIGLLAAPVVPGAGYEGDPDRTADAFRDLDGVRWSVPGDMARLGADGRLRLLGRGNQVINTGGEKVFADEVELALRTHPGVRDAVVVGVPDERWGTTVGAVVSLVAGARAGADELAAHVGTQLAGYKKPRRIAIVDEVPRLVTGKADLRWARSHLAGRESPVR
ncbi:AMP-binding protein [Pseudonocardia nematodicida]|uniref:AMP-binding protein n=1 Tax=Pseudonocardia nematodicida TaxID=1206997 RepID=A0ABV1K6H4_9PSEU